MELLMYESACKGNKVNKRVCSITNTFAFVLCSLPSSTSQKDTMAKWLALMHHSKGPGWGGPNPLCVKFTGSPQICVGLLLVLRFPLMHMR